MAVVLTVEGDESSSDELRDLGQWLRGESALRGRVLSRDAPPAPDELGIGLDALVMLAATRLAPTVASVLIEWLVLADNPAEPTE